MMMGSRAARARKGLPPKERTFVSPIVTNPVGTFTGTPVPRLTQLDVVFGNVDHLPRYDVIPERFHRHSDPFVKFVSDWFFTGRTQADMAKLTARPGVDRGKALAAIKAILVSWAPKHEHKEAGCAYLLHEWFNLEGAQ
jgi:hypothetical protein